MVSAFKKIEYHKEILIILILSLVAHFIFFGYPKETVFDEVHFGKFISGYMTGEHFFDIHPPLGKLLIAGMGYLGGFTPGFSFTNIGEKFPDDLYMWLRFLPVLAGAILPLIIYFLVLELGFSKIASFSAGILLIFENSILTQSLFMLLDSFLLLFGFLGLLLYFLYKRKKALWLLLLSSVSLTFALSIKWTGFSFFGIVLAIEIIENITKHNSIKELFEKILILLFLPALIYFSVFCLHFRLLPKSGPGNAYMSPAFQKTLVNSSHMNDSAIKPLNLFGKFFELNGEMYRANKRLNAMHPYSSKWYTWPFMMRPVYYWNKTIDIKEAKIYLIGNPFIYWVSTVAMLFLLTNIFNPIFKNKKKEMFLLGGGYLFNLLPFIGINRVMFLYHYFSSLVFAILALAFLIDSVQKNKTAVFMAVILAAGLFFLFFSPLTYGIPLSPDQHENRAWIQSWK